MKFLSRYINRLDGIHYFRTVWADGINEATRKSERYAKKGYILLSVVESA